MTSLQPLLHPINLPSTNITATKPTPSTSPTFITTSTSRFSSDLTFTTTPSSQPLYTFTTKTLSAHSRKTLTSSTTNTPLLILSKHLQTFTLGVKYTATLPSPSDSNTVIFHTESNGERTLLTIPSTISGWGQEIKLHATRPSSAQPETNIVDSESGQIVATVRVEKSMMKSTFEIEVAEGMDTAIVCALVGLMETQGKNETSAQTTGVGGGMAGPALVAT